MGSARKVGVHLFAELCHREVVNVGWYAGKGFGGFCGQREVLANIVGPLWPQAWQGGDELPDVGRALGERPSSTTEHQCSRSRHGRGLEKMPSIHRIYLLDLSPVVVNTPGSCGRTSRVDIPSEARDRQFVRNRRKPRILRYVRLAERQRNVPSNKLLLIRSKTIRTSVGHVGSPRQGGELARAPQISALISRGIPQSCEQRH